MNPILIFKNLLFTVLVPGTVGVYVPMLIAERTGARAQGVGLWWLLGIAFLALGGLIYMLCVVEFMSRGRGTPAPIDPPSRLVISGLYRYIRNPMYVGVLSVVLGWAALTRSAPLLLYAVAIWAMFQLVITLYEEPALTRTFGESYQRYCREVGRWLPRRKNSSLMEEP